MSDLYGFNSDDLDATRRVLEGALDVRFVGHNGLYWGGDYDLFENDGASVSLNLRHNRDLLWQEGDPPEEWYAEPEFAGMALLLDAEHPEPETLKLLLTSREVGAVHLRREPGYPAV